MTAIAEKITRRAAAGSMVALGLAAILPGAASAETLACNSDEKCEAKCGFEDAFCCNGQCIRGGCGHDRNLNRRTCKCERRTRRGKVRTTPPKLCGA